ncbi:MAG: GIY-YIG nuclease family protein [Gordonia sp. (in: high G+C Gram-positive bacteria)]
MTGYVYILRCGDGSTYVGSTRNLENRMAQHYSGRGGRYTSTRQPVTLVYSQEFDSVGEAYAHEKRIQGWSRAQREPLIEGDFDEIRRLSRKKRT